MFHSPMLAIPQGAAAIFGARVRAAMAQIDRRVPAESADALRRAHEQLAMFDTMPLMGKPAEVPAPAAEVVAAAAASPLAAAGGVSAGGHVGGAGGLAAAPVANGRPTAGTGAPGLMPAQCLEPLPPPVFDGGAGGLLETSPPPQPPPHHYHHQQQQYQQQPFNGQGWDQQHSALPFTGAAGSSSSSVPALIIAGPSMAPPQQQQLVVGNPGFVMYDSQYHPLPNGHYHHHIHAQQQQLQLQGLGYQQIPLPSPQAVHLYHHQQQLQQALGCQQSPMSAQALHLYHHQQQLPYLYHQEQQQQQTPQLSTYPSQQAPAVNPQQLSSVVPHAGPSGGLLPCLSSEPVMPSYNPMRPPDAGCNGYMYGSSFGAAAGVGGTAGPGGVLAAAPDPRFSSFSGCGNHQAAAGGSGIAMGPPPTAPPPQQQPQQHAPPLTTSPVLPSVSELDAMNGLGPAQHVATGSGGDGSDDGAETDFNWDIILESYESGWGDGGDEADDAAVMETVNRMLKEERDFVEEAAEALPAQKGTTPVNGDSSAGGGAGSGSGRTALAGRKRGHPSCGSSEAVANRGLLSGSLVQQDPRCNMPYTVSGSGGLPAACDAMAEGLTIATAPPLSQPPPPPPPHQTLQQPLVQGRWVQAGGNTDQPAHGFGANIAAAGSLLGGGNALPMMPYNILSGPMPSDAFPGGSFPPPAGSFGGGAAGALTGLCVYGSQTASQPPCFVDSNAACAPGPMVPLTGGMAGGGHSLPVDIRTMAAMRSAGAGVDACGVPQGGVDCSGSPNASNQSALSNLPDGDAGGSDGGAALTPPRKKARKNATTTGAGGSGDAAGTQQQRRQQGGKGPAVRQKTGGSSIYKGVSRHRWSLKWEAHLWDSTVVREEPSKGGRTRGAQVYLGGFPTELEAARAYDMAAIVFWGDQATTNFPRDEYHDVVGVLSTLNKETVADMLRKCTK